MKTDAKDPMDLIYCRCEDGYAYYAKGHVPIIIVWPGEILNPR